MSKKRGDSLFWGVVLLSIGIIFLLNNFFDIDIWDIIFDFWPMILIGIGIKMIIPHLKSNK